MAGALHSCPERFDFAVQRFAAWNANFRFMGLSLIFATHPTPKTGTTDDRLPPIFHGNSLDDHSLLTLAPMSLKTLYLNHKRPAKPVQRRS